MFEKLKKKINRASIEGVYAGPEQMAVRPEKQDVELEDVYAGPGMMGRFKNDPSDIESMTTVYAGPDMFDEPDPKPAEMKLVYAGPGQFIRDDAPMPTDGAIRREAPKPYPENYASEPGDEK